MRDKVREFLAVFASPEGEERTGFDFVWMILLLVGFGVVLTLLARMLLLSTA